MKHAHECQEYGETQEFCDDIEYIMDGLRQCQPVATRCLWFADKLYLLFVNCNSNIWMLVVMPDIIIIIQL